ncbi:MAG: helix-turn-helix domain-containing protein [Deltaproteobacteria bacterium]|nr:helix-turn-helix domain-containing protein [Deltaproteobacteria bacterium]
MHRNGTQRIVRLRRNGHTVPSIAEMVEVSRATVERVLAAARNAP